MLKKNLFIIILIILVFSINSCKEKKAEEEEVSEFVFPEEFYSNYNIINYANGKGYEFKNENSTKLIITLDGGPGWSTVVGEPGDKMDGYRLIEWLLPLQDEYNFFVPQKFNWDAGTDYYYLYIVSERERYTVDNLMANYLEVINEYLSHNNFDTIIIIGYSEGAKILPMLYLQLDYKEKVTALIVMSSGGLSKFESYEILLNKAQAGEKPFDVLELKDIMEYCLMYENVLNAYREEPFPDTIGRMMLFGTTVTYRWMASIINKRPFDYLLEINIPVLFRHGKKDVQNTIESARYVEEHLPNKPFDYIYDAEMGHYPTTIG